MPHRLLPLAGSQVGDFGYLDAPFGLDARFNRPFDCELSKDRNYLYVSDFGNNVIRRITLSGSYPVETFCPAPGTTLMHVNPTTGNLWFMSHEGTSDFWTAKHHITKVTPAGDVSFVYTFTGEDYFDCLPDPNERYIRVKGSLTYIPPDNTRYFFYHWWIVDILAGSIRVHNSDGNAAGGSGQMWSKNNPDTYFWLRRYQYPSDQGASLGRAEEFGDPYEYNVTQYVVPEKIVNGPDARSNETYFGLADGYMYQGEFRADATAPYISPAKTQASWLGLPRLPAVTLVRDQISDVYYFPMEGGNDVSGLGYNIPYNTVSVAVPNNQLSFVIHRETIDG